MSLETELKDAENVVLPARAETVDVSLRDTLRACATAFEERPSAQNWSMLQGTMYAWQFWSSRSPAGKKRLADELWPIGVGRWVSVIAAKVGKHFED